MKILFVDLGDTRGELNEPLGVECISSRVIRKLGVQTDMLWYGIDQPCLERLLDYDFIGLSMNIGTLGRFAEIYSFLRKYKPDLPLVIGGCIPTFAYMDLLEKYEHIICSFGEGEDCIFALAELAVTDGLSVGEKLLNIPNLAFKLNGKIVVTAKQPVDLQKEQPIVRNRRFLEAIRKRRGIVRVEGSRGCSWNKCSFCCVNAKYANPCWRAFPEEKILSELRELSSLGFHAPYFTDEDFFGHNYPRSIELANQIIALKRQGKLAEDMNFFISILAADAVQKDGQAALAVWKKAGLREVFLGIESFEPEQLKRYRKKANLDTNRQAIAFIDSVGLQIDSGYILFDPLISFDALGANIRYIETLKLNSFDSRSLKRLRLQPMTSISADMSGSMTGGLNLDQLEYPYAFRDERVGQVYAAYKIWEDMNLNPVWEIQSASRGEVAEGFRVQLKHILGQIRDIDFSALNVIYQAIAEEKEASAQLTEFLQPSKSRLINQAMRLVRGYGNS